MVFMIFQIVTFLLMDFVLVGTLWEMYRQRTHVTQINTSAV